jgi:hypothetical protein
MATISVPELNAGAACLAHRMGGAATEWVGRGKTGVPDPVKALGDCTLQGAYTGVLYDQWGQKSEALTSSWPSMHAVLFLISAAVQHNCRSVCRSQLRHMLRHFLFARYESLGSPKNRS